MKKFAGWRWRKRWGQNFLKDERVLDSIAAAARLEKTDFVLEIGPGQGALTRRLAGLAGTVMAVEIDRGLCAHLRELFAGQPSVKIVEADFLKLNLAGLWPPEGTVKVVANLPYSFTTPILFRLLPFLERLKLALLMVQKEVAQRLVSGPGSRDYGVLSLGVQALSRVEMVAQVSRNAFFPRPRVDSALIKLTSPAAPPLAGAELPRFLKVVRAAFAQRRQMLVNSLAHNLPPLRRELLPEILVGLGLDGRVRAEELALKDYVNLTRKIYPAAGP